MRHGLKILACVLGACAGCGVARADVADAVDVTDEAENPYQPIVDRNVFGLRPIPPPAVVEPPKPPAPKITLAGITTILGNKRAHMKSPAPPAKQGESPKTEEYYSLAVGQRQGSLEVLEIDERAFTVKVRYDGVVSTLDYENNGAKVIPVAAAPVPGVVPRPGGVPGAVPTIPAPGGMPANTTTPTRALRLPTATGMNPASGTPGMTGLNYQGYQGYQGGNANLAMMRGGQQVTVPVGTSASSGQDVSPLRQMPVEQQLIMIEAERERTRNQVAAGLLPPLPPTVLTPPGGADTVTPNPAAGQDQMVQFPPRAPGLPALPQ